MTLYCQHTFRLRLQFGRGKPDVVSERPRNVKTEQFTDGPGGTQVEIPPGVTGMDVGMLLATGAIATLPCQEHPPVQQPAADSLPATKGGKGG